MKKLLITLPIMLGIFITCNSIETVNAIGSNDLIIPDNAGKLTVPQNTKCRAIDYSVSSGEIKRTPPDGRTTFTGTGTDIYDLCIGSFPRFPSTKVEGGIDPYYYLKYRLLPDPMPVYSINTTPLNINGSSIVGINQTFTIDMTYEALNKPSDEDIFLFYPYDKNHVTEAPIPGDNIRGPYQIGYNSFFHNTYRSRYFASEVTFQFEVLEPKKGETHVSSLEGINYPDKTLLFSGEIIYTIPDSCYEETYLDYKSSCREIEFYFPKGDKHVIGAADPDVFFNNGKVEKKITPADSSSQNVITKDRAPYMNPGEHNLIVNVEENTQLRVQKDIGTEYQTKGNEANIARRLEPWTGTIHYFNRTDKNIDGSAILPITTITQIPRHNGKPVANSGRNITDYVSADWEYDTEKNTDWLNYCEHNADSWGNQDNTSRTDNSTGSTPRDNQTDKACYHSDSLETHFWQYRWSNTGWYAKDPRP